MAWRDVSTKDLDSKGLMSFLLVGFGFVNTAVIVITANYCCLCRYYHYSWLLIFMFVIMTMIMSGLLSTCNHVV